MRRINSDDNLGDPPTPIPLIRSTQTFRGVIKDGKLTFVVSSIYDQVDSENEEDEEDNHYDEKAEYAKEQSMWRQACVFFHCKLQSNRKPLSQSVSTPELNTYLNEPKLGFKSG